MSRKIAHVNLGSLNCFRIKPELEAVCAYNTIYKEAWGQIFDDLRPGKVRYTKAPCPEYTAMSNEAW
jgi:hypothetical protein